MNEFGLVQTTVDKIFAVLNESHLSGMTIYYMLGDIQRMVKDQIQNHEPEKRDADSSESNT